MVSGKEMSYDPDQHHRRSIRLKAYDYASAGAYFATICTQGHVPRFGEIISDEMQLNDAGGCDWGVQIDHDPRVYGGRA